MQDVVFNKNLRASRTSEAEQVSQSVGASLDCFHQKILYLKRSLQAIRFLDKRDYKRQETERD